MRSPSIQQVGLVVGVAFTILVLGIPHVTADWAERHDPERCTGHEFVLYESAEEPAEVNLSEPDVGHYRTLTDKQQTLVERAARRPNEHIETNQSTYIAAAGGRLHPALTEQDGGIPHVVVYDGSVYRTGYDLENCQLIPGIPVAFNPVLAFVLFVNESVTGPLAPLLVVGGGLGLAWWAGRLIQY